MGRIVVLSNPLDSAEREEFAHSGPFIDWLTAHYPNGFETPHVSALNLARLSVEDYDTPLGDNDTLVLAIYPASPLFFAGLGMSAFWAGVTSAIVGTVISIGLSYAINALFGPKAASPTAPKSFAGAAAAGSVYNLATPTNTARIGQPIPAVYGKNILFPDLAAQPYAFYSANQQYVDQILCLGHGEFEIEDVRVGMTNVAEMGSGVVSYSVWPGSAHGQTFGVIQAATGIYENVYTSAEVSDQELVADLAGGFSAPANLWNGSWSTFSGGIFMLNSDEPARQYVQMLKNGSPVWAVVTDAIPEGNNGSYVVGFIEGAGYTQEYDEDGDVIYAYGRKGHLGPCEEPTWTDIGVCLGPTWPAGNGTGIINLTITPPGTGNLGAPLGPYVASPPCMLTEHLQYDIVFPSGCFKADPTSGALLLFNVQVRFVAELVDNLGAALGPVYETTWSEDLATNTPQRRTIDHVVPKGRYRVTAERITPMSDLAQDQSKCNWVGLKSILGPYCDSAEPVYGDVTMMAVRIKATEGLSSASHNRVSVKATRKLNGVATRHPVDAFKDIFINQLYGGRRPLTELDTAALETVRAEVADCKFDAIFDQRATIWEALKLSVQMIRGVPVTDGSVVSLVRDKPQNVPVAGFSQDNITALTRSYLFVEADDFDGIEGEYIDPLDGSKQYVVYPETAANPEQVTLWGCTSLARAQCYIRQFWLQRSLRRRMTTFETEMDAHTLVIGDPINITHPTFGANPVLHVVSAVTPKDEFTVSVEAFVYEPGVFA